MMTKKNVCGCPPFHCRELKEENKERKCVHLLTSLAENAKKKGEGEVKYSATPSSLE